MNMKLTKRKKSVIIIYSIATIVFLILTIGIPFAKPAASWMMFAFSIVSLAGGCGITLFAFSKSEELKSKFYGYPVFRIGSLYTIIQLALTVLIYIIGAFVNIPYWVGLVLSVLVAGLASIGVITVDNARDYVEETEEKIVFATKTIKKFNVDIADILGMCKDEAAYLPLKKLVERFKYSDIVSNDETAAIEEKIKLEIEELRAIISSEETDKIIAKIDVISNLLSTRNALCEQGKK